MNRNELKNLTRQLRELPPVPIPPGLEGRLLGDVPMLRRAARSRRVVFAIGGAVAVAACLAVALLLPRGDAPVRKVTIDSRPTVPELPEDLRELQAEMRRQFALADRIEARERRAKAEFAIQRSQAAIALERELAATILVLQGDWQRTRGETGVAEYRKAIELFADTSAAAKAKLRLNET
jgi:hypothetical protein